MLRYKVICAAVSSYLLIGMLHTAHVHGQETSQGAAVDKNITSQAKLGDKGTGVKFAKSTVDRLNVRTKPDLNASVIQMIGQSNRYKVVKEQGDWLQIQLTEDQIGWIFREFTEFEVSSPVKAEPEKAETVQSETETADSHNQAATVRIVDVTNLRSGPGTEYDITGKAKPGETYPIVETKGEWYVVALPDQKTAYVASWVVQTESLTQHVKLPPVEYTGADPLLYIYHTHNQESWNHVASLTKGSSVDDPKVNITLVGERLGQLLQEKGIPALAGSENIAEMLKQQKLGYSYAYEVSREVVNKAIEKHPTLLYFFDIHRDADVPREKTTITIDGTSYARVMFVIGTAHAGYEGNKAFAEQLNKRLNEKYPGLSRGIITKSAHQGNGEYNQSVSPGSLLLEIGGANNTLQESLQTAEALADVFADYYGAASK